MIYSGSRGSMRHCIEKLYQLRKFWHLYEIERDELNNMHPQWASRHHWQNTQYKLRIMCMVRVSCVLLCLVILQCIPVIRGYFTGTVAISGW